ncbi:septum formation initiator [Legionella geestiana]|uniref:Cell division protein FtsB n=1 Tax=Legionella geestiana TaxID=45065 RepID=A0A0W0U3S0_9GAMM|nr:septum formation initiator family protein [Legionella geestiana]KTD02674.1 septum formation initiator [Legionella geestiana]QBS12730.1 cell division protein FtsB [Legionella geestiana]QDQ39555.1 cell division protein FtsB [Legionella geestiana]STX54802.1 cell division protein FtsB [Legionella geestiana]
MKTVFALLILLLLGLQYKLWFGDGNVRECLALEERLDVLEAENERQAARNRAAEADILELKRGEQALEEQARSELGMIQEGESYFQFVD